MGAQHGTDALGRLHQHLVTHLVAPGVVDTLEVVQIQKAHRQQFFAALGVGDGHGQPVIQQAPVGQPGQHVIVGDAVQFILMGLELADVGEDGDVIADLAVLAAHGVDGQQFRIHFAAAPAVPDLTLPAASGAQFQPHLLIELAGLPARAEHGG